MTEWLRIGGGDSLLPSPCWPALQSVQQNGSIYIHVYFTKSGFHPDPRQKALYRRLATVHMSRSKSVPTDPTCRPGSQQPGRLKPVQGINSQVRQDQQKPCAPGFWGWRAPSVLCGHPLGIWESSRLGRSRWTKGLLTGR